MTEHQTYISIEIRFYTAKAAHKYCDCMQSFEVGSELYFGLNRFRLFTTCGAGYMRNTANGKIILTVEGWTQWSDVTSDDAENIIRYFVELSKAKPEQIEIFIKDALWDKHYLITWRAADKDYFRTSSVSDDVYKGIRYTTDETNTDRQIDTDEQLLKKFLRSHTPYNKVRYWYLTKLKSMPYL